MISAHCYVEPNPLPPIDGLPQAIADLVRRCLAKTPDDRPTSREVARTLAAAAGVRVSLGESGRLSDEPSEDADDVPIPVSPGPSGRRPTGRVRAAIAVLMASPVQGPEPAIESSDAETALVPIPAVPYPGGSSHDMPAASNEPTRPINRRRRNRVVQVGAGGVGLVAAALALTMCANSAGDQADEAAGPVPGHGSDAPCAVRYQTVADTGSAFRVDLTIRNTGAREVAGWTLVFTFPGDQRVDDGRAAGWTQTGNIVTVRDAGANANLRVQGATTVGFTGSYRRDNALPTEFTLNGQRCAYTVIGASGETKTGNPNRDPGGGAAGSGELARPASDPATGGGQPSTTPGATLPPPPPPPTVDPGGGGSPGPPKPSRSRKPRPSKGPDDGGVVYETAYVSPLVLYF
jgi:hypothetical protein